MKKLLSLIALFCAMAIGLDVSLQARMLRTDQRGSFAQIEQTMRREGILSSRLLSPRLLSSPLLWRLLSPWFGYGYGIIAAAGGVRSSHLPLVMRSQPFDKLKR